jgi:hypothetical protein
MLFPLIKIKIYYCDLGFQNFNKSIGIVCAWCVISEVRNNPEERSSLLLRGGSLKPRTAVIYLFAVKGYGLIF